MPSPIKRSAELTPLSRDHHNGLLLCWKIRTGINKNISPERIVAYVLHVYESELKEHFRQEEEYIFSILADDDTKKQQALEEHQYIYEITKALSKNADNIMLLRIANVLETHIRFEERDLFNYIERQASPAQLAKVSMQLAHPKTNDSDTVWQDKFWSKS